jgi:diadenosine tetraphosphate (Ap4A) HIT family hydrolase
MADQPALNATLERFEYPTLLIRDYQHWSVLLRRHQATLGALILCAKANVIAWPDIGKDAFSELSDVTTAIETTLKSCFGYDKINYLMLMMADPNPHFHVIPRYSRSVAFEGVSFDDPGWPKTPDLGAGMMLEDDMAAAMIAKLKGGWVA